MAGNGFGFGFWRTLGVAASTVVVIAWILRTGFWDDAAPWDDTQSWVD